MSWAASVALQLAERPVNTRVSASPISTVSVIPTAVVVEHMSMVDWRCGSVGRLSSRLSERGNDCVVRSVSELASSLCQVDGDQLVAALHVAERSNTAWMSSRGISRSRNRSNHLRRGDLIRRRNADIQSLGSTSTGSNSPISW